VKKAVDDDHSPVGESVGRLAPVPGIEEAIADQHVKPDEKEREKHNRYGREIVLREHVDDGEGRYGHPEEHEGDKTSILSLDANPSPRASAPQEAFPWEEFGSDLLVGARRHDGQPPHQRQARLLAAGQQKTAAAMQRVPGTIDAGGNGVEGDVDRVEGTRAEAPREGVEREGVGVPVPVCARESAIVNARGTG
jgi:hypothetical protein